MNRFLIVILLIPIIGFSQRKREVIDSIHTQRMCVEYPGLVAEPDIVKEFQTATYVFVGKVVEIIRKETMETSDVDRNGPTDFQPIQNYWYVLEVSDQFKGKQKKKITVLSRIFSNMSPLLILNGEYLIYAQPISKYEKKFFKQSHPFIYCNGRSMHLKYAEEDIKFLKKLTKK